MFKLIVGLISVMFANVLLGTNLAQLKDEFNKKKAILGLLKVGGIVFSILLMLGCAYCTQDIIVANINGSNANLLDAMRIIFISAITYYGTQDINKLINILKVKIEVKVESKEPTIQIPEKNIIKVGDE